jgi:hypothetical protein
MAPVSRAVALAAQVALLALCVSACSAARSDKPGAPTPAPPLAAAFGSSTVLALDETARYPDGLQVQLKQIEDSRCPKDATCVWEGELAPVLRLAGGSLGEEQQVRLGTVRSLEATVGAYAIALGETTETRAAITVTNRADQPASCRRTGCSSEVCSDRDQPSSCIYRPEYACYDRATCERQASGECGWTQTPELSRCLAERKASP